MADPPDDDADDGTWHDHARPPATLAAARLAAEDAIRDVTALTEALLASPPDRNAAWVIMEHGDHAAMLRAAVHLLVRAADQAGADRDHFREWMFG